MRNFTNSFMKHHPGILKPLHITTHCKKISIYTTACGNFNINYLTLYMYILIIEAPTNMKDPSYKQPHHMNLLLDPHGLIGHIP